MASSPVTCSSFSVFYHQGHTNPVREYVTNTDNEIQTWQPDDNSKCETSERVVVFIGVHVSVFCRVLRQCRTASHLNPIKQQSSCCSRKWKISHPVVVPKSLLDSKKPLYLVEDWSQKAVHCFLLSLFASLASSSSVVIHTIFVMRAFPTNPGAITVKSVEIHIDCRSISVWWWIRL